MIGNLLKDPLLTTRFLSGGEESLTLPGVLGALQKDEIASFPALRPHQAHPWHTFLVQLAALALEGEELPPCRSGEAELPSPATEEIWRRRLRKLTPDHSDAPWCLVVDDLKKPAFFQPPVLDDLSSFKNTTAYPDDLDILVTARNHGTKAGQITYPAYEDWMFAILTLQTFSGFFGQGNYGVARMNGGFATRPGVQLVSRPTIGGQWTRDVRVLLDNPEYHRSWDLPMHSEGHKFLWILPWDGKESLPLNKLHPWWLEICRLVRLVESEQNLTARSVGTKATRISAKNQRGNVGDPWIPILMPDAAAFNSRPTYRVCQSLPFPFPQESKRYPPSLLQQPHAPDNGHALSIRFRVLNCGQGRTEGYTERTIPIPRQAEQFAFGLRKLDAARISRSMVEQASTAQFKVLKPALLRFMQAAREQADFQQPETNSWANAYARDLDKKVDQMFFQYLWQCLETIQNGGGEDNLEHWKRYLRDQVKKIFGEATRSLPVPHALWPKALAKAEGQLYGGLRKHLNITNETQGV